MTHPFSWPEILNYCAKLHKHLSFNPKGADLRVKEGCFVVWILKLSGTHHASGPISALWAFAGRTGSLCVCVYRPIRLQRSTCRDNVSGKSLGAWIGRWLLIGQRANFARYLVAPTLCSYFCGYSIEAHKLTQLIEPIFGIQTQPVLFRPIKNMNKQASCWQEFTNLCLFEKMLNAAFYFYNSLKFLFAV